MHIKKKKQSIGNLIQLLSVPDRETFCSEQKVVFLEQLAVHEVETLRASWYRD